MSCATQMVKYLIFFFNFLVVAGGIFLIAVGALMLNEYKQYETIIPDVGLYKFSPVALITAGAIIFLIAFMGCCGTLRESKCMMMTYATLLLIILAVQIGIAVLLYTNRDDVQTVFTDEMQKSMKDYNNDPAIKEVWDLAQSALKCCGANGAEDWIKAGILPLPTSCCENNDCTTTSQVVGLVSGTTYTEGCVNKVIRQMKTETAMYGAAIVAAVELFGIIFGCCLGARFGRKIYHT